MKAQSVLVLPFAREPVREGLKAVDYTFHQVAPIRFDCTSLTVLQMFHDGDNCAKRLLLSNPGLKTLGWGGFSASYRQNTCTAEENEPQWRILTASTIPVQLHSLESLTLQRWKTGTTTLVGVLSQCPPTLTKLGLIDLQFDDMKSPVYTQFEAYMLWDIPALQHVKELDLGFGHPMASEAILYLLCSILSLRKLTLQIRRLEDRRIITTFCEMLAWRGKNLNTLHILQSREAPRETVGRRLRLHQWEELLELAPLNIQDFRLEILPTALALSPIETSMGTSLRRLEFSFLGMYSHGTYDRLLSEVSYLLRNCRNLQWAKIQMSDKITTHTSPRLVGHDHGDVSLWRCPELRELHLVGIETVTLPGSGDCTYGTWNYGPYFLNPLKMQIKALPKLRIVTLNYATFWSKKEGYSPKPWTKLR